MEKGIDKNARLSWAEDSGGRIDFLQCIAMPFDIFPYIFVRKWFFCWNLVYTWESGIRMEPGDFCQRQISVILRVISGSPAQAEKKGNMRENRL